MDLTHWKTAKKEQKLTIAEIAERANLPKGTVQNIFAGYVPSPRLDTVQAIERALGIDTRPQWTDEERALGVGNHPINVSDEEMEWLELRSKLLSVKGEEYLKTLKSMVEAVIEQK